MTLFAICRDVLLFVVCWLCCLLIVGNVLYVVCWCSLWFAVLCCGSLVDVGCLLFVVCCVVVRRCVLFVAGVVC